MYFKILFLWIISQDDVQLDCKNSPENNLEYHKTSPASIRTTDLDPRLVLETWLLFETRLLLEVLQVAWIIVAKRGIEM